MQKYKINWFKIVGEYDAIYWTYNIVELDNLHYHIADNQDCEIIAAESLLAADNYAQDICDDYNYYEYESLLS